MLSSGSWKEVGIEDEYEYKNIYQEGGSEDSSK